LAELQKRGGVTNFEAETITNADRHIHVLFSAKQVGNDIFGMALAVVFSLGLAAVLTVVGLLFVKGSRIFQRVPRLTAWGQYLPVSSVLVITALGLVLTAGAAMSLGL